MSASLITFVWHDDARLADWTFAIRYAATPYWEHGRKCFEVQLFTVELLGCVLWFGERAVEVTERDDPQFWTLPVEEFRKVLSGALLKEVEARCVADYQELFS